MEKGKAMGAKVQTVGQPGAREGYKYGGRFYPSKFYSATAEDKERWTHVEKAIGPVTRNFKNGNFVGYSYDGKTFPSEFARAPTVVTGAPGMTVVKISPTKDADAVPAYQLAKDGSIHPLPGKTLTAEERELYGHSGKAAKLGHAGITKERDEFGKLKGYRYGGKFHPSKLYSATAEEPLQPVITEAPQAVGGQPRP